MVIGAVGIPTCPINDRCQVEVLPPPPGPLHEAIQRYVGVMPGGWAALGIRLSGLPDRRPGGQEPVTWV